MYIVTFYSFKGGVGRTLALVNIGVDLARQGRRVLLVDFDLEAPGIETFDLLRHREPTPGIVDYVTQYLQTGAAPDVREFAYEVSGVGAQGGRLWVTPAGKRDDGYGARLNAINWQELYDKHSGYLMFEDLKAQWKEALEPDYVLIDSRTGHTDIGGICTRQLPDAVVIMFFPNEQNLRGLRKVVADIRAEARSPRHRQIQIHFVTSNVPDLDDEERILASTLHRFQEQLQYNALAATIHHYSSLALLNQVVFTHARPASRLTREYQDLLKEIVRHNSEDPEGALDFLRRVARRPRRINISVTELEDRLKAIGRLHASNGQVLYELAQIREEQGRVDEALNLLSEALNVGYGKPDVFLKRAELYTRERDALAILFGEKPEERPKALDDLWQVLNSADVSYFHVSRAVRWLHWLDPHSLVGVPEACAVRSLDVDGRAQVAQELFRSRAALRAAEPILRTVLKDTGPTGRLYESTRRWLILCLIGLGRFRDAMALISPERPNPADLSVADAFNYAMAEWGAIGSPPRDLLQRVVDLDRAAEGERADPNYEQCLAMAHWLLGNPEEASHRLQRARQQLMAAFSEVFSAWRYLTVVPPEFLADLDAMEEGFEARSLEPVFIAETTRTGTESEAP